MNTKIPPQMFLAGSAIVSVIIVLMLIVGSGIIPSGSISSGTCGSLSTLSSQLQYTQNLGVDSYILNFLDPDAQTFGVFKGQIAFTGVCETINAQKINDSSNTYTTSTKSFYGTLNKMSCDYTMTTANLDGKQRKLTSASVVLNPGLGNQGTGACTLDSNALITYKDLIGSSTGKYIGGYTLSQMGGVMPVSCENYYNLLCSANPGYKAYYDTSKRAGLVSSAFLVEPADCIKVESTGTGMFLSNSGGTFKPNTQVTINYGGETIVLNTANNATGKATSDKQAYFRLANNYVSNNQNCPTTLLEYYKDDTSTPIFVDTNYQNTLNQKISVLQTAVNGNDLASLQSSVNGWNTALSSMTQSSTLGGQATVSGKGQFVSIDRTNNPYLNPIVDFIVVADKITVTANVAKGISFVDTNPKSGQCAQTTTTTTSKATAKLFSRTAGKVLVNVACNSPLGTQTSEQELTFSGLDYQTATFNFNAPANNYTCVFTANNEAIGSASEIITSNSFCVISSQTVYQDCNQVAPGTLKQVNPTTGKCECLISGTQGTNICASTGMNFNGTTCTCVSKITNPSICSGQPTACGSGKTMGKDGNNCNVCVDNGTNTTKTDCQKEVDAIKCESYDMSCQINKINKSTQCTVEDLNSLLQNAFVLILFGVVGLIAIIVVGFGAYTLANKRGRK